MREATKAQRQIGEMDITAIRIDGRSRDDIQMREGIKIFCPDVFSEDKLYWEDERASQAQSCRFPIPKSQTNRVF